MSPLEVNATILHLQIFAIDLFLLVPQTTQVFLDGVVKKMIFRITP